MTTLTSSYLNQISIVPDSGNKAEREKASREMLLNQWINEFIAPSWSRENNVIKVNRLPPTYTYDEAFAALKERGFYLMAIKRTGQQNLMGWFQSILAGVAPMKYIVSPVPDDKDIPHKL